MIRNAIPEDSKEICNIYNHYISNTIITFEEEPVTVKEMQRRIMEITKKLPWIVYTENDTILGYAYASEWKSRCAYKNSVESTVYVRTEKEGKGIGTLLYRELIKKLSELKFHAVIGGIALPNNSSIALHEKLRFEKVAHFKEVGNKFNKWIDVGYWELIL